LTLGIPEIVPVFLNYPLIPILDVTTIVFTVMLQVIFLNSPIADLTKTYFIDWKKKL